MLLTSGTWAQAAAQFSWAQPAGRRALAQNILKNAWSSLRDKAKMETEECAFLSQFHYLLTICLTFTFGVRIDLYGEVHFTSFFLSIDVALSWKRTDPFLQEHWSSETEHPQEYFIGLNPSGPGVNQFFLLHPQCSSGEALDNNTVYHKHWSYFWKGQNLLTGFLKVQYVRPKFCFYKHQAKM